jgi:hypothetical protein
MPILFKQKVFVSGVANPTCIFVFPADVAKDDLLVFSVWAGDNRTLDLVADTLFDNWQLINTIDNPIAGARQYFYYAYARASGPCTVTLMFSGLAGLNGAGCLSYSGVSGPPANNIAAMQGGGAGTTLIDPGGIAVSNSGVVLIAGHDLFTAVFTPSAGYTIRNVNDGSEQLGWADFISEPAGIQHPTLTVDAATQFWSGITVAFGAPIPPVTKDAKANQLTLSGYKIFPIEKDN